MAQSTTRSSSDQYTPTLYGASHDGEVIGAVETAAKQIGRSMAQTGIAWLLSKPGVTAPIIGATRLIQLEEAIAASDIVLEPEMIAALEAPYLPRKVAGIE